MSNKALFKVKKKETVVLRISEKAVGDVAAIFSLARDRITRDLKDDTDRTPDAITYLERIRDLAHSIQNDLLN